MTMVEVRSRYGIFAPAEERARLDALCDTVEESKSPPEMVGAANDLRIKLQSATPGSLVQEVAHLISAILAAHQYPLLQALDFQYPAANLVMDRDALVKQLESSPTGPLLRELPRSLHQYRLLNREIGLPFGIPATVTTASVEWLSYFARNGFNVLTTRTFRTRVHEGFPPPHFLFVQAFPEDLLGLDASVTISLEPERFADIALNSDTAAINSYGIPSADPNQWSKLVSEALGKLASHQMLIVSVVGSGESEDEIVEDFVKAAKAAARAGAHAIELNLSFPTTFRGKEREQLYCENVTLSRRITEAVALGIDDLSVAIVAKLAYLPEELLRELVPALAPIVDGISGINALPISVFNEAGGNLFPERPARPRISGAALRNYTKEFVQILANIRRDTIEHFDIIATGGVMADHDARTLRELGADAIQSATGSFLNPFLAWDVHQLENLGHFPAEPGGTDKYVSAIRNNLERFTSPTGPIVPERYFTTALNS